MPSEPTDLVASRSKRNRANVSWSPPNDDGGSPVTGYVVTVIETGAETSTSNTSVTLTGISKNEAYTISVAAVNAVGSGPAATVTLDVDGDGGGGGGPKCHPKKGC